MQQCETESSLTTINQPPPHLQHLIFASAAAPLTTCKASAAISSDASLAAQWLLVKDDEPLLTAVENKLWKVCDILLGTHQYTPDYGELGEALIKAAKCGATDVVSHLLQWCCKRHHYIPCDTCMSVYAALYAGVTEEHMPIVSLLAQHPSITAQYARDAVCAAAKFGSLEALELLITSRPDASNPELEGCPMDEAARCGQLAAMQLLVQHGADIHNSRGKPWSSGGEPDPSLYGVDCMPAHTAAFFGHLEIIKWLHEQGLSDIEVALALQAATKRGDATIAGYLLRHVAGIAWVRGLES
jgi:hypothetical protein